MMIKGSLLRSVPHCKAFRAKISKSKNGPKFEVLGFGIGKILTLTIRPLGNQSPPKHVIWRKTVSIDAKMWSPEAGKKFYKEK